MESDLLIRQEEVGPKREYDFHSRLREIFMWDVFDPDELLPKRPAVKGSRKWQPVGHKRKCSKTKNASTAKDMEQECKLDEQTINGRPKEVKNQDQQKAPIMKIGMSCIYLTAFWRAPDSDACYICGQDGHYEQICPYNYIYGLYGLYDQDTCRADCLPGQHTIAMAYRNLLRSFIHLNNMPSCFCTWDLRKLLEPFGPLLMCDVPMGSSEVRRGYGVAIFKDHGDWERSIETLNGYLVGKSKLRVDWAYAMPPGGRSREKCKISTTKRVFKRRPPLQGAGKQRALGFLLPKFWRFYPSCNTLLLRRRKSNNTVSINEDGEKRKSLVFIIFGCFKLLFSSTDFIYSNLR